VPGVNNLPAPAEVRAPLKRSHPVQLQAKFLDGLVTSEIHAHCYREQKCSKNKKQTRKKAQEPIAARKHLPGWCRLLYVPYQPIHVQNIVQGTNTNQTRKTSTTLGPTFRCHTTPLLGSSYEVWWASENDRKFDSKYVGSFDVSSGSFWSDNSSLQPDPRWIFMWGSQCNFPRLSDCLGVIPDEPAWFMPRPLYCWTGIRLDLWCGWI